LALLISIAIWLEDGRPIFFIQQRIGREGKPFYLLKFRTLGYRKSNSLLAKMLRKTALDELPQLINIFKGEMSFVGPRPFIPEEVLNDKYFFQRFKVKPGLTGVAQIFAFRDAPSKKKLKLDLWYIKNMNIVLDLMLILKSVFLSLATRWDAKGLNERVGK